MGMNDSLTVVLRSWNRNRVIARFFAKMQFDPNGGECWLWKGAMNGKGYGTMKCSGCAIPAHRIAYYLFKGERPPGKIICHTCDIRSCVNPKHLIAQTYKENTADAIRRGRMAWQNRER